MPEGTDLFEIMQTPRAMRRLKPDPGPDELTSIFRNYAVAEE